MKRLLIMMVFGLGVAVLACLIGLAPAPAYATQSDEQVQFDVMQQPTLAPVAIDTGPGDYNFSGTVVFAQYSTTYVDTGEMPIDTSATAAMKIDAQDANVITSAPSQPDHPMVGGELAKSYGEQASVTKVSVITNYGARLAPGDEGMSARFSNERTIKKT
jgi:hypothetical protein